MLFYDDNDLVRDVNKLSLAMALHMIPGFLRIEEGYALMALAATTKGADSIVEVGSFKGKSTCFLAAGCKTVGKGKIYAVDHFSGSAEHKVGGIEETREIVEAGTTLPVFRAHIAHFGYGDVVNEIVSSSADAAKDWTQPIRMLFIDGDHSYTGTKADFDAWLPFVEDGGIICFHDYENNLYLDGITRFIQQDIMKRPDMKFRLRVASLVVYEKQKVCAQRAAA